MPVWSCSVCVLCPFEALRDVCLSAMGKNPFPNTDCEDSLQSQAGGLKRFCHSETATLMCIHPVSAPPHPSFPEYLHASECAKHKIWL